MPTPFAGEKFHAIKCALQIFSARIRAYAQLHLMQA
jgi:hypothetical protein